MAPIGALPGDTQPAKTEMGHPRGKPLVERPHCDCSLSRPGQGTQTTKVVVTNTGWDLGVEGANTFEQRSSHLGPEVDLLASDKNQVHGLHPCLPSRLR